MQVVKRDGRREAVQFDKITGRISKLCNGLDARVDASSIALKVIPGIRNGIHTSELDILAAETAAFMTKIHPDFSILAGRILISNLHKSTCDTFSEYVLKRSIPNQLSETVKSLAAAHASTIDAAIQNEQDYSYDFFAFKTMEKSYLLKDDKGTIIERPQYMLMRVALGIHEELEPALETYRLLSQKCFTHATPTLFNAGTCYPQMSSCFLLSMKDDSLEGIYETLKQCALISKYAGGIGLAVSNIRSTGSYIKGGGTSNGLVPMLSVFERTARYVDQGGGKRKGGFAMYLEPWHPDIFEFLDLKKNHGKEELRARDLFYGLWIPDLFMKRVQADRDWSLFCPKDCPELQDLYGNDFEAKYEEYEAMGKAKKTLKAQKLWFAILDAQIETGTPYLTYKDASNIKSNQKNLGTIHCSNLCTEIIEYSSPEEVAVCNLASISLPSCIVDGEFSHEKLRSLTGVLVRNLNKIIDKNHYPVEEARVSNFRHRPIGLGVQGLADAFMLLKMPFDSPSAEKLNTEMFETIYFAALEASCKLAEVSGAYATFQGSPVSLDILQFDMWGVTPSKRWDWKGLREAIKVHGVRNSLLVAPMPTASTAQILGNTESVEPITSNVGVRRVLSGEFQYVNKYLVRDLDELNLWDDAMYQSIVRENGSVQHLERIPEEIRQRYKTVWEIRQRQLIIMAKNRGAFIDQSQSLNLFIKTPSHKILSSMHHFVWESGLKSSYYLRTMGAADAIKFTVDAEKGEKGKKGDEKKPLACSRDNPECLMCSG